MDNCKVGFFVVLPVLLEEVFHFMSFSKDDDARGFTVESMDDEDAVF